MPTWLAHAPTWVRPVALGVSCGAVWLMATHSLMALARWLSLRPERAFKAFSTWRLGRLASAIAASAALDAALIQGALAPADVGLRPPDWAAVWQWLPSVMGILTLWLALLWGATWWGRNRSASIAGSIGWGSLWNLPAHLVFHEASLAILRGALVPALGAYWGAWAAIPLKGAFGILAPGGLPTLQNPDRRPWALLEAALDWLSTAVIIPSNSLWPGMMIRCTGLLGVLIAYRLVLRVTPQNKTSRLSQEERPALQQPPDSTRQS